MAPNFASEDAGAARGFATTRWSIVLASSDAGGEGEESHRALSELCRVYWRPVFAFIRRAGYSVPDAQDLTQGFFLKILQGTLLQRADPQRGRFRTLLLRALVNFLHDDHSQRTAVKRGGGAAVISWEEMIEEVPSLLQAPQAAVDEWSPERLFDVRWAATVVERAQWRLREEFERSGRVRVFEAVRTCLSAERSEVTYHEIAKQLGASESAIKQLVHRLRQRYRALLREEVSHTVATKEQVEEELRYLCAVLTVEKDEGGASC